jgi:hypothetical protein
MSLFKGKKKKAYTKKNNNTIQTTIDSRHNNKINELENKRFSLNEKNTELDSMQNMLDKYNEVSTDQLSDNDINDKLNLQEKIRYLEKEISDIQSDKGLIKYTMDTSHLLYEYYNDSAIYSNKSLLNNSKKTVLDFFGNSAQSVEVKKTKSEYNSKNDIMDKYLSIVDNNHIKNVNNVSNEELDNCPFCVLPRIQDNIHGCMICPTCGNEEKILVDCDTPSYKEPPRELTYFAYKKINHANEWLSQFQAKESTDISEDIFDKIIRELKKESYINLRQLSVEKVRDILKKLDLTKYYEHCHYITNRITGKPAPVITGDLEEKVRNMFKEIQGPWMKYCPSDRSNFFSYPYIFYKFFQLLDKDEYLSYCRLLKSREKLQEHDEVWKKICDDLKWQYIPTV